MLAYAPLVKAVLNRILPQNPCDREECMADVFVSLWRNAAKLDHTATPLRPWLIVTARNKGIDRYNALHRREALSQDDGLAETLGVLAEFARAPADAAANEHIDAALRKQSGEGAMASAVAADDFRCDDFSVFDFVDFELLRVAEMLEDLSVGIGGCDFHSALLVCFAVEMGHVERSFRKGAAYVSDSFQPLFPYRYRVYAIARIAMLVFSRTLVSLRPVLLGHALC